MPSRNKAGCSCCDPTPPPECDILTDDFDRSDDTDLGADWTEISGGWEIASNQLFGNGMVLTSTVSPDGPSMHAAAMVKAGGTAYLYVAANSTGTAYIRGRLVSGAGTVQVSDHTGASASKSVTTTGGNWYLFTLCYDEATGLATASVNGVTVSREFTSVSFDGYAGVGATTDHDFDDFVLKKVEEDCEHCVGVTDCSCCDDGGGYEYDVTVAATYSPLGCDSGECEAIPTTSRVTDPSACTWNYVQELCTYPIPDCSFWVFRVDLIVFDDCNLRVLVRLYVGSGSGSCSETSTAFARAVYEGTGDGFFAENCEGPFVLDFVSSDFEVGDPSGEDPPCTPTWPATVTVERVT